MDNVETVAFISTEDQDDFVVSFYIDAQNDLIGGRSLNLIRDRKWEALVPMDERGVKVSDEGLDQIDDNDIFLEQISFVGDMIKIETTKAAYKLDLRKVDSSEVVEAREVLKKMNYDKRFILNIAS